MITIILWIIQILIDISFLTLICKWGELLSDLTDLVNALANHADAMDRRNRG